MRTATLLLLLLSPLAATASEAPTTIETSANNGAAQMSPAVNGDGNGIGRAPDSDGTAQMFPATSPAAPTPADNTPSPDSPDAPTPIVLQTPQPSQPPPPPTPLGFWSMPGFLYGGPVTLSHSPSEGIWQIKIGASTIVLHPARREATIFGHAIPWPALPLAPGDPEPPLQAGPEMPERPCRFWTQETPQTTHAWCLDAQGRPQRILVRQGEQWHLIFDAATHETLSLWRILRAIGG